MNNGQLLEVNGKKLYVEVNNPNSEKAILYLHGGPGESCFDFTYHQKERLGKNFQLIAIDQRGVCRSESIENDELFGLDDLVEDCEELRRLLGIEKWSVIGHSFGGYLAVLYASRYPGSINKVIFEGPTFDFELTAKALLKKTANLFEKYDMEEWKVKCLELSDDSACSPRRRVEGYMELSDHLEEHRMEIYTHNFTNPTDTDIYTDEEWDEFYDKSEIHYKRLSDEGKIFESALPLLKLIKSPCLLLLGKYDVVTCPTQIHAFLNDVEYGEIYTFNNSGHTPHYESADEFCNLVTEYLTK